MSDVPAAGSTAPVTPEPAAEGAPSDPVASSGPVAPALSGLVVDWGGVLTASLDTAMTQWADGDGVDFEAFRDVLRQWVGRRDGRDGEDGADVAELEQATDQGPAGDSPLHRLERGELPTTDFERELAAELAVRGHHVPPEGLLDRLLAGLTDLDPRMLDLVRRARAAGLRTALLSNSWGDHYPDQLWEGLFDAVVISGRVGMRKPEPDIFRHACEQLGLPAAGCVMVDDLPHNVIGAVAVGMVGVVHRSYDETLIELEALFGVPLH